MIKVPDIGLRSRLNILEGHDVPFDMTKLRVPGSLVLAYIPQGMREGYKSVTRMKCRPCAFMGYEENSDAYRLWDLNAKCDILAAREHCISHQGEMPFKESKNWTDEQVGQPRHFWWPPIGDLTKEQRAMYGYPESSDAKEDQEAVSGGGVPFLGGFEASGLAHHCEAGE